MTLKTQLTYWVECYKDVAERNALAETPKESAEYLLSLILSEIDKAGLTDEQFYAIRFCIPDVDLGCTSDIANCNLCEKRAVAAAQLEAIKKQLRGEGK